MMRFSLVILVFIFISCNAQKHQIDSSYVFELENIVTEISFEKNKTFTYKTNSPHILIKQVYGKWQMEGSLIVLNSYVNKKTPQLKCERKYDENLKDSVLFNFMYVDSSNFEGFLYPSIREDSSLLEIVSLKGKTFIHRNDRINKVIIDGEFSTLLTLSVDFKKYNSYQCFVNPDRYASFDDMRFKIEPNRIVSVENEADYYNLKK